MTDRNLCLKKGLISMDLGSKIRKYRLLNDLTQKDLGMSVGFSAATSDSRIRKYEVNDMAPKHDIRTKLANALNVDIEALSDVEISSFVDVMYVLFELEEKYGLTIEKSNGKTAIVFDDSNIELHEFISYLNIWKQKMTTLSKDPDDSKEYDLWKSHFKSDLYEFYQGKEAEINDFYHKSIKSYKGPFAKTTTDLALLLRALVEEGVSLSARSKLISIGLSAQCFTFKVNEMLNPPSDKAKQLFTRFLAEFKRFNDLGANVYTDLQIPDRALFITYCVEVTPFNIVVTCINNFLEHYSNAEDQSDFAIARFEKMFSSDLEMYSANIEESIKSYKK